MQAEQEVLGLVSCRMSVANNLVLHVLARFEAASLLVNPIQVLHKNLVIELLVSPIFMLESYGNAFQEVFLSHLPIPKHWEIMWKWGALKMINLY